MSYGIHGVKGGNWKAGSQVKSEFSMNYERDRERLLDMFHQD